MYVDRIKYAYIRVFSTVTWPIYNAYGPTSRPMHFIFCRRARDYDFFMHVRAQMHVVSCVLCFVRAVFCCNISTRAVVVHYR